MTDGLRLLSGKRFRVTEWTVPPGECIPEHVHEVDYVVLPVAKGEMVAVLPDGTEIIVELDPNVPYERQAGARHRIENRSSVPVVFREVEHLSATTSPTGN